MNPLEHLSAVNAAQWPELHRRAVADGAGRVLHPLAERTAAVDELVALTLPELAPLGVLAMLTEAAQPCGDCAKALSHNAAGVLRLVDSALAAHGRDNSYPITAWLEQAFLRAHERAHAVSRLHVDELPASTLVEAASEALAGVVMALHRDRLGVPEALADALGSLLGLYAAGMGTDS